MRVQSPCAKRKALVASLIINKMDATRKKDLLPLTRIVANLFSALFVFRTGSAKAFGDI